MSVLDVVASSKGLWWQHPPPTHCSPKVSLPLPETLKCLMVRPGWVWQVGTVAQLPQNWELGSCSSTTPTQFPGSQQPHAQLTLSQIWLLFCSDHSSGWAPVRIPSARGGFNFLLGGLLCSAAG